MSHEPSASLKPALRQLHDALHSADALDEETKALLRQVAADIDAALEAQAPHAPTSLETLEQQALAFEARHPALTEAVQAVADALRKAGV